MKGSEPAGPGGSSRISFDDVVIDLDNYEVVRAGEPVATEPQVFDVLRYLIEHRDRVVTKVELFDSVWGDRFVSESALTSRIKSARQAVGDDGRQQRVIRTTHGRGYRFVAELSSPAGGGDGAADGPAPTTDEPVEPQPRSRSKPNRVPAPARPLVARDRELAALIDLLATNRLVTVVGPGGVGKTRLATEVATSWDPEFDEPTTFVALAPIASPDEVLVAIRDALGIGTGGSVDAFGAVREALSGKTALLVLDNFEHVIDAATALADLVELVPGLRLLVTSRERLGLAGEQVLELEPFVLTPDGSGDGPAVAFFEHAVRGVRSDVDLDPSQRDDIVAICRTLDALPLAIELAAAQTRYFSLSYLRSHLESAAITVADHARDRPERHHTMQSTIAWSYQLVTPSQQRLLASLSVYRASWPLGAADAMTGVDGAAPDLLALVDKSLVQRSDGVLGEPRFSMLRLVRDFASAELDASGSPDEARRRHASFVRDTVRSLGARRWDGSGDGWIDAITSDYADVVAALSWCFADGDVATGCEIVEALGFWWYRTGRIGEGRGWVDHALANTSVVDDSTAAWIHSAAGTLAAYELRRDDSFQHYETALAMARDLGDERLEALTLCHIGAVMAARPDDHAAALELVERGLDQARRLANAQLVAHGLTVLGELSRATGHPERAETAYREALDLDEQLGDRHYEAINTLNMGHALMAQDRTDDAMPYYQRGIELASLIGSRLMMAWNLSGLAAAHHVLGQPQLAAKLTGAAQATLEALGSTHGPVDQPVHERRQRVLRDELGDDYDGLVAEGNQLSLEEAIELAFDALAPAAG